jgi:hypothetical protein
MARLGCSATGEKILTQNNSSVCFNKKEIPKVILYGTEGNFGSTWKNAVILLFPSKLIPECSGSRVRGFKPGRSRWIFLYIYILSMPSFGGEFK